jgi:hypothetical protein
MVCPVMNDEGTPTTVRELILSAMRGDNERLFVS